MSHSFTHSGTSFFTLAHAKELASKVTADMKRCQQHYYQPSDDQIIRYGTELALLLKDRLVSAYEFGFQTGDKRFLSWSYTVDSAGALTSDDRPGKIVAGLNIAGTTFFNLLTYSANWDKLTPSELSSLNATLPFVRDLGAGPTDGAGYRVRDNTYSAGGVALPRTTFRPY